MARAGVFDDVDVRAHVHPGTLNAVFPFSSLANFQVPTGSRKSATPRLPAPRRSALTRWS
jgi:hypothetical protein